MAINLGALLFPDSDPYAEANNANVRDMWGRMFGGKCTAEARVAATPATKEATTTPAPGDLAGWSRRWAADIRAAVQPSTPPAAKAAAQPAPKRGDLGPSNFSMAPWRRNRAPEGY